MGRRPSLNHKIEVNGLDKEVQGKVDEIAMELLKDLQAQIKDRISKGQLSEMHLVGLIKQFKHVLQAIKKPSTSLAMVQQSMPLYPQPVLGDGRARKIEDAAMGGGDLDQLRAAQARFLENNGESPR